jgi:hypothetical protein
VKIAAILAAIILSIVCGSSYAQNQADAKPHVAPSELTILKHSFGSERRFVTESIPESRRGGEPTTRVVAQSVMIVSVKAKNNNAKTIIGVSWYFVLANANTGQEVFSQPFVTPVDIAAQKTKIFKGQIERLPLQQRAVTVDELKHPVKPAQERIVITCVMFSDGSLSPLNDASRFDCGLLQTSPELRKKIEKR